MNGPKADIPQMIHHIIISVCINGLLKANKSSLCTLHIVVTENKLETIIIVYVLLELEICLYYHCTP